MNARERYIQSITFGSPDKVFFSPGTPRESTIARWHKEGLPEDKNYFSFLCETLGIECDEASGAISLDVSFKMIPEFEEKIREHKDGHYIVQDWSGAIVEISDRYDFSYLRSAKDFVTRKWHKFPVETPDDWYKIKKRYNPHSPERFPKNFRERCLKLQNRDKPLFVAFHGPFWQMREWCGFENLCMMIIQQPEFVEEMATFWTQFVSNMLDIILEHICPDRVLISEDMAYKGHSMISPKMVYKFLMPSCQEWIPKLRKKGCPAIE